MGKGDQQILSWSTRHRYRSVSQHAQGLTSWHHIYADLFDLWWIKSFFWEDKPLPNLIFSKQKQHLQTKLMLKKLLYKKVDPSVMVFYLVLPWSVKKKDKYGWNFLLCCYHGLFLWVVWAAVSVLYPNLSCIPEVPAALHRFLTTLPLHLQSSPGLKTWNI